MALVPSPLRLEEEPLGLFASIMPPLLRQFRCGGFLKIQVLKPQPPDHQLWLMDGRTPERWDPAGEKLLPWVIKGYLVLFSLLPQLSCSGKGSRYLPNRHRPKATEQNDHWLKNPKLWATIILPFSYIISGVLWKRSRLNKISNPCFECHITNLVKQHMPGWKGD